MTDNSNMVLDCNIQCKLDSGDSAFALEILLWQLGSCKMLTVVCDVVL